ncbi:energy-coupling factor transporter ATPase [Hathewaya massiliensis]|uniref:energy-coupling factor transporter ATPase n=1 Tax=Hathewaya massiliensis TaxID=1964382 RepID=UPI00115703A0|nr:energy-coupling factor transporter ATPase [Hathewaya massiliensis]
MDKLNCIIKCEDLTYSYIDEEGKEIKALNGVNLDVYEGEFLAILGHNGSGKSTLAKLFNGLLTPKEGNLTVYGMNTREEKNIWDIRKKVGMVFQNPDNQIVATIVEEDVAFGPENLGMPSKEIRNKVDGALKSVGMYEYRKHSPNLLSGGQKQRVAIAGILAMDTNCIIFDESTAMLDPIGRQEVINTALKLNKEFGKTIILITHYMEEVVEADRLVILSGGEVCMQGTPKQVFSNVSNMKSFGLDVPEVTELAYELRKVGVNIEEDIINMEEMVDALCSLR